MKHEELDQAITHQSARRPLLSKTPKTSLSQEWSISVRKQRPWGQSRVSLVFIHTLLGYCGNFCKTRMMQKHLSRCVIGAFRRLDSPITLLQIFILDRKEHTTSSLYHPGLATTQGPALLAYNDANFESHDWDALEMAYESSKATDSS